MQPCPQCGSFNGATTIFCAACGYRLLPSPPAVTELTPAWSPEVAPRTTHAKRTPGAVRSNPAFKQTLLGLSAESEPHGTAGLDDAVSSPRRPAFETLAGITPDDASPARTPPSAVPESPRSARTLLYAQAAAQGTGKQTLIGLNPMLGGAPPADSTHDQASTAPPPASPARPMSAPASPPAPMPPQTTNPQAGPHAAGPHAAGPHAAGPRTSPSAPSVALTPAEPAASSDSLGATSDISAVPARRRGVKLLGLAAALAMALGVFYVAWDPPKPVAAELRVAPDGSEELVLSCDNCPEGSRVRLGDRTAPFEGAHAVLALDQRTRIGANRFVVSLERPGLGRNEELELTVPVRFRLQTDLTQLSADPPRVNIQVAAEDGSEVTVDGQAIAVTDGHARVAIPIVATTGEAAGDVVWLERSVTYAVTPAGEARQTGELQLKIPVVPLTLTAPGAPTLTDADSLTIVGRTVTGATVLVNGVIATVDASGRFRHSLKMSSEGDHLVQVTARMENHAPRNIDVTVTRVADLKATAREFQSSAVRKYSTLRQRLTAGDTPKVALPGRVEDARSADAGSMILLNVASGCEAATCLIRVLHGQPLELEKGARLSVFGTATRLVEAPMVSEPIPEIQAAFVLR